MTCAQIPNGVICFGNGGFYEYKGYKFEFDPRFGPALINEFGSVTEEMLDEDHPFWPVFEEWQHLSKRAQKKTILYWTDYLDEGGYQSSQLELRKLKGIVKRWQKDLRNLMSGIL